MSEEESLDTVRGWIDAAQRVVVLTGAGISTDSGIPDFRGPNGVWTRNPAAEKQSTIQNYLADAAVRQAAWRGRLENLAFAAEPNRGHLALVELERRNKLHALITQNVDELHQRAGNSPQRVIEVHGTVRRTMCWDCGERRPMGHRTATGRQSDADASARRVSGSDRSAAQRTRAALDGRPGRRRATAERRDRDDRRPEPRIARCVRRATGRAGGGSAARSKTPRWLVSVGPAASGRPGIDRGPRPGRRTFVWVAGGLQRPGSYPGYSHQAANTGCR